jgi:hypothetical protein
MQGENAFMARFEGGTAALSGGMAASGLITEVVEGKVYALRNLLTLDGRVSAYPGHARGYSVSNSYLLREPDGAAILDTGYAANEQQVIAQIGSLIAKDTPVTIFPLRINEFMSVGNAMAICRDFNVVEAFSPTPDPIKIWINFASIDPATGEPPYLNFKSTRITGLIRHELGTGGKRFIEMFQTPIRLINTTWIWDEETRTLFTSDSFTQVSCDNPNGPWIIDAYDPSDERLSAGFMQSFLLNTRYWWIEGARTETLRRGVEAVFKRYPIETIAPGYGAILRGRALVEQQFGVLDDILRRMDRTRAKAYYVSRDLVR